MVTQCGVCLKESQAVTAVCCSSTHMVVLVVCCVMIAHMDELTRDETEKEERKREFVKKKWRLKNEFGDLEKVNNSFNRIYRLLYFDVIV